MKDYYEARINVYLPDEKVQIKQLKNTDKSGHSFVNVKGSRKELHETALKGINIEVGGNHPSFDRLQAFVAYYYFTGKNTSKKVKEIRVRSDYKFTDWLKLEAEVSHDNDRGSVYFGGLSINYSFDMKKYLTKNRLHKKMTSVPTRDIDIITDSNVKVIYENDMLELVLGETQKPNTSDNSTGTANSSGVNSNFSDFAGDDSKAEERSEALAGVFKSNPDYELIYYDSVHDKHEQIVLIVDETVAFIIARKVDLTSEDLSSVEPAASTKTPNPSFSDEQVVSDGSGSPAVPIRTPAASLADEPVVFDGSGHPDDSTRTFDASRVDEPVVSDGSGSQAVSINSFTGSHGSEVPVSLGSELFDNLDATNTGTFHESLVPLTPSIGYSAILSDSTSGVFTHGTDASTFTNTPAASTHGTDASTFTNTPAASTHGTDVPTFTSTPAAAPKVNESGLSKGSDTQRLINVNYIYDGTLGYNNQRPFLGQALDISQLSSPAREARSKDSSAENDGKVSHKLRNVAIGVGLVTVVGLAIKYWPRTKVYYVLL